MTLATHACVQQNRRPQAGDCMHPTLERKLCKLVVENIFFFIEKNTLIKKSIFLKKIFEKKLLSEKKIYVFEKKLFFVFFFLRNKLLYETKISFYEKSSEKNLLGKFF